MRGGSGGGDGSSGAVGQPGKQVKEKLLRSGSSERSWMTTNFLTMVVLLRLRINSYEKTLFLLILVTFLMIVTNMNNYLQILKDVYPDISQTTLAFSLMTSLRYLDIAQLLNFAGSNAGSISMLCSIYLITMTLCYVTAFRVTLQNPQVKPRKFFYGRWFVNLSSYFVQLLSFPFAVIFLSFIFCTDAILPDDGGCGQSNSSEKAVFAMSLVGIILLLFSEWWLQVLFFNLKWFKKDATRIDKSSKFLFESSVLRWIIALFTSLKGIYSSSAYLSIFLIVQLVYTFFLYIRISFTSARFTFATQATRNAYQYAIIAQLSQFLAFTFDQLSRVIGIYPDSGGEKVVFFYVATMMILLLITDRIRNYQVIQTLFQQDLLPYKLPTEKMEFIIAMFQSLNKESSTNLVSDALMKGIIGEHLSKPCPHPNQSEMCFCKMKVLYDPKKRKDTTLDKVFQTQNNSIFTKFIVKSWFETHLQFNASVSMNYEYLAYLAYAEFLYFKLRNVSLALKNLAVLENKYLTPLQQYHFYRLKKNIIKHNRKRNHDSYRINQSDKDHRNKLEIESVIPVEEQIAGIQAGIKYIIKNNIKFWNYLEKANVNLHDLNELAKFSLLQLDSLKLFWKNTMYYLDYRKKWRFYYCWYYLYILNRKIKIAMLERFSGITTVNENDVFSEEIQQDNMDDDLASVHSNLKPEEMEKIQIKRVELAFDKKSVIFHVNHEIRGRILKVNRAVYHAFGYSALELSGQVSIGMLMPRIYQNVHPLIMQNFNQTGKTKTLYSQRRIFCLNKLGYLFKAWKFVKQFVTLTGKCEYVSLIRPITPPAGTKIFYVILNDDWEVDSMSQEIYEGFGLQALPYQSPVSKQLLNILVLCPRLIRYTKYSRFLTETDYKLFIHREHHHHGGNQRNHPPSNQVSGDLAKNTLATRSNWISKFKQENTITTQLNKQHSLSSQNQPSIDTAALVLSNSGGNDSDNKGLSFSSSMQQAQQQQQQGVVGTTAGGPPGKQGFNFMKLPSQVSQPLSPVMKEPPNIQISQASPEWSPDQKNRDNKNGKKKTMIFAVGFDKGNGFPLYEASPRQISRDIASQDSLQVNSQIERQNSANEMLEQLNLGQNMQFLQTNYIRDEILKKKNAKNLHGQQQSRSLIEDEEGGGGGGDEEEAAIAKALYDSDSDGDDRTEKELDENGEETYDATFEKIEDLEKGDVVHFRLRIPHDLDQMVLEYYTRQAQIAKRQFKGAAANQSVYSNGKSSRFQTAQTEGFTLPGGAGAGAGAGVGAGSVFQHSTTTDSRDRHYYNLIKEQILNYQLRKARKEFATNAVASYKKVGKQRIIVLKLSKMEESARRVARNAAVAAAIAAQSVAHLANDPIIAEDLSNLHKEAADPKRLSNFMSMRSELSDGRDSITNVSYLHNFPSRPLHLLPKPLDGESLENELQHRVKLTSAAANDSNIGKNNGMGYQMSRIKSAVDSRGGGGGGGAVEALNVAGIADISMVTFHKDFANRQGAKNINLSQTENIYIKEDNHKPNKEIKTIQNLRAFVRLFFLTLVVINGFTFFYGPYFKFPTLQDESQRVFQTKNILLQTLNAYNVILDQVLFNNNSYDAAIDADTFWDDAQFQTLLTEQMDILSSYFYSTIFDTNFRQTFFDKQINSYSTVQKSLFLPEITTLPNGFTQKQVSLDTYDQLASLVFSLQTIKQMTPSQITLDQTPVQFFRNNTFPYLYNGLGSMQKNLLKGLKGTTDSIYSFLIVIIILGAFLMFFSFLLLTRLIIVICDAFKSVIEVFPKISLRDMGKIKNYNINLFRNFSYIIEKDDYLSGTHSMFLVGALGAANNRQGTEINDGTENGIVRKQAENYNLEEPNDGNENVGKKLKDVADGGFLVDFRRQILILFAVFILFVGMFTAGFLLLILQSTLNMQLILDNGEIFMESSSDNSAMMIAIKEKSLAESNYRDNFQSIIQTLIDEYLAGSLQPHVDDLNFMNFDGDFNEIYYGNPCEMYANLFVERLSKQKECIAIAQGSLQKGIASFNAFYKNAIEQFIAGKQSGATIDPSIIFEYNRGIYYANLFQIDLISIWGLNTQTYLQGQLSLIIVYVVIMFLVLFIVYLVLTEQMLLGRFNEEYTYFRTVYKMYMPDIIILKEKRIKFWLVKHFVLNK